MKFERGVNSEIQTSAPPLTQQFSNSFPSFTPVGIKSHTDSADPLVAPKDLHP